MALSLNSPNGRLAFRHAPFYCKNDFNVNRKEDDANKVERLVRISAAALLLESSIGRRFDAIVTGASEKGTWVRLFHLLVAGKLRQGVEILDVGDRVRVERIGIDVE